MANRKDLRGSNKGTAPKPPAKTLSEAAANASDTDLFKMLRNEFVLDWRSDNSWREEKKVSDDFYDGDQWSPEELESLKQRGQPDVTINRVKPKIDALVGMALELRVDTKAFPKGMMDFQQALHISQALKHVEQLNQFDDLESDVYEDVLRSGRGWYRIFPEWDGFDAQIRIEQKPNEDIVVDRFSRLPDLSDAKRLHDNVWMDEEDAKALFPGQDKLIEDAFQAQDVLAAEDPNHHRNVRPDQYKAGNMTADGLQAAGFQDMVDLGRRRLRVVKTFYREVYAENFITEERLGSENVTDVDEGSLKRFLESYPEAQEWRQLKYRLHCATFVWSGILKRNRNLKPWDDHAKYDYVKSNGYKHRRKGFDYGLIRQMRDPQKETNKRRSKHLHLISVNQTIRTPNAVDNPQRMRKELARADGDIVVNPGERFEVVRNLELSEHQYRMLQESKREVDEVGIPSEIQGQSRATSGYDYQLRLRQSTSGIRKIVKNSRASRRRVFLVVLDYIQRYWTDEMMIKITDDPNAPPIKLNERVIDQETGQEVILNNMKLGKYDIIIDEAEESINSEGEEFERLTSLALKGFPVPPQLIAKSAPTKYRDEWLAALGGQVQNPGTQGGQPPPQ